MTAGCRVDTVGPRTHIGSHPDPRDLWKPAKCTHRAIHGHVSSRHAFQRVSQCLPVVDTETPAPAHTPAHQAVQWHPDHETRNPAPSLSKKAIYRDYAADKQAVFNDLVDAVTRLGHKIAEKDPENGRLVFLTLTSFFTWRGQKMTATVTPYDDRTRIQIQGTPRARFQYTDWGEAERKARKVLRTMDPLKPIIAQNLINPYRVYKTIATIVLLLLIYGFVFGIQLFF